jgi:myo-inositol-1(or 4)-monophosphatase
MSGKTKNKTSGSRKNSNQLKPYRPTIPSQKLGEMLAFAKGLAQAAGKLAMSYYGKANPILKYDHSLVTEADLAVQEYLCKELKASYPTHRFLGEEDIGSEVSGDVNEPIWVVDPVDGSAAFSKSLPIWGVAISLFDGPRAVLGVFFMPVTNELYAAKHGSEGMLNDRPIKVRDEIVDNESLLLTYSRFHSDYTINFPGKLRSLGSTVAHIAYVARGASCGAVIGNVHVWDLAAGLVILEAAGGSIKTLSGKKVDLSAYLSGEKIDQILIAAPNGQHREITDGMSIR